MGRLDDAAKRKVVELRKAGLSFRKIKAVLELENIKVSAQAIYLFLKEFQGKSRPEGALAGHAGATQSTTGVVSAREVGIGEGRRGGWSDQQLRSLLREASRVAGYSDPTDSSQQSGPISEARGQPSGAGGSIDRGRDEQQDGGKEDDIRIISVTSLAQGSQQGVVHPSRSGVGSGPVTGAFIRRRYTPSPASNPVLVARKRLLDKALLHKARMRDSGPQTGQQMASLMRREQTDFSESDGRKVMLSQTPSYDLTTSRAPQVRGLHQGAGPPRRPFQQRVGVPVRSLPQLPRMRLPTAGPTSAAPQGSSPTIRVQAPANQPSPTSQQSGSEAGMRNTLQEQFHSLSSEIRSLGLALRMMVEQQTRLEREQAQQTQIQKQILNTLQGLASKLGTSSLHHTTAPTPPASCSLSAVSFSQSTLTPSHGTYTQCSQAHSRYSEMEGPSLESMEAFSLDGLSSSAMNGFQPCSTSDGLSFTHTQTNTPAYTQSHTQPFSPVGSHSTSYTQSHSQTYAGVDSKTEEMPSTSAEGSLQDCNASSHSSSHPVSPITLSPHGPQLNIIKIESV